MIEKNSRKQSEISEEESMQKNDRSISFKLEETKTIIKDVLIHRHSELSEAFGKSLEKIAIGMYSNDLISVTVKDNPNFKDIMDEFQSGMDLIHNVEDLVEHCNLFLKILVNQRGPPNKAALIIAKEWIDTIKRDLNIKIEFKILK